jgi:hypothetical protein
LLVHEQEIIDTDKEDSGVTRVEIDLCSFYLVYPVNVRTGTKLTNYYVWVVDLSAYHLTVSIDAYH